MNFTFFVINQWSEPIAEPPPPRRPWAQNCCYFTVPASLFEKVLIIHTKSEAFPTLPLGAGDGGLQPRSPGSYTWAGARRSPHGQGSYKINEFPSVLQWLLRKCVYFHRDLIDFMDGAPPPPCGVCGGGTLVRGGGGAGEKYKYFHRNFNTFYSSSVRLVSGQVSSQLELVRLQHENINISIGIS